MDDSWCTTYSPRLLGSSLGDCLNMVSVLVQIHKYRIYDIDVHGTWSHLIGVVQLDPILDTMKSVNQLGSHSSINHLNMTLICICMLLIRTSLNSSTSKVGHFQILDQVYEIH